MNLCPHEDDPHICPPCQRDTHPQSPGPVASTIAKFNSRCPVCDGDVMEGNVLVKYDDTEPWVCDDC